MTQTLFNEEILQCFAAEKVAPLVTYLCHECCETSGNIYDVIGGWVAGMRLQRNSGMFLGENFTAEDVKRNEAKIHNFDGDFSYPMKNTDTIVRVMTLSEAARPKL